MKASKAPPLIKICGLSTPEEAGLAASLGASLCGFIFHPPSPRSVSAKAAAAIETPGALRVGVFVNQSVSEIDKAMALARLDLAQLHGGQGPEAAKALGPERVIKVFWPERAKSPGEKTDLLRELDLWRPLARWLLFDAGISSGGHGRKLEAAFDSPAPYFLAGGLTAGDILSSWPGAPASLAGYDLSSSLESSPGRKDPSAIKALFEALAPLGVGRKRPWPRKEERRPKCP
ncbi:MAG: phosphoribosylanthranilate isomerase [Deltaproteobacteria bacterium]|jgi:phosphoribosylanthranilate isomerase|nr:phosphoribosylanthranilate isomerase [Deltaproteobacteria bacterium]